MQNLVFFGACHGLAAAWIAKKGPRGTLDSKSAFLAFAAFGILKNGPRGTLNVPRIVPGAFLSMMSRTCLFEACLAFFPLAENLKPKLKPNQAVNVNKINGNPKHQRELIKINRDQ